MLRRLISAGVTALSLAACHSAPSGTHPLLAQRGVIGADEIAHSPYGTLYEAVQRLRPEYLRTRGVATFAGGTMEMASPVVYCDRMRLGGIEWLRNIQAADVVEVRFLSANEAQFRYGSGHLGGVIDVRTKQ